MRTFINVEVDVDGTPFNRAKQLYSLVANPPKGEGIKYDEMKKAIEILDLFEELEHGQTCILEEAQYTYVSKKIKDAEFTLVHREIVNMIDAFMAIERQDPMKE